VTGDEAASRGPYHERGFSIYTTQVRRAIVSVEVAKRNLAAGDGTQEYVHKVKLIDKGRMHELLARHVGLFEPEPLPVSLVPAFVFTDTAGIQVQ
jgi:hypothetical protein